MGTTLYDKAIPVGTVTVWIMQVSWLSGSLYVQYVRYTAQNFANIASISAKHFV